MPVFFNSALVFGMYLRSSLRMSSVRMKTKLGLAVSALASPLMLLETPKESRTTKTVAANDTATFLIFTTPL